MSAPQRRRYWDNEWLALISLPDSHALRCLTLISSNRCDGIASDAPQTRTILVIDEIDRLWQRKRARRRSRKGKRRRGRRVDRGASSSISFSSSTSSENDEDALDAVRERRECARAVLATLRKEGLRAGGGNDSDNNATRSARSCRSDSCDVSANERQRWYEYVLRNVITDGCESLYRSQRTGRVSRDELTRRQRDENATSILFVRVDTTLSAQDTAKVRDALSTRYAEYELGMGGALTRSFSPAFVCPRSVTRVLTAVSLFDYADSLTLYGARRLMDSLTRESEDDDDEDNGNDNEARENANTAVELVDVDVQLAGTRELALRVVRFVEICVTYDLRWTCRDPEFVRKILTVYGFAKREND